MGEYWDRMACTPFLGPGRFDEAKYARLRAEHEAADERRAATIKSGKRRGGIPAQNLWFTPGSRAAVVDTRKG